MPRKRIGDKFQPSRGHLDQAQLRPVGGLAHEFGVDRDKGLAAETGRRPVPSLWWT